MSRIPHAVPAPASRYERGLARLNEVDGTAGVNVINALQGLAPDLARYIIEFGFGDVYDRPGLSLPERELVTLGALAALGHASPQLKVHVHAALNVGLTREAVVEALIQVSLYAGFPAALNALFAAREVFDAQEVLTDSSAPLAIARCFVAGLAQGRFARELLGEVPEWYVPGRSEPLQDAMAVWTALQAAAGGREWHALQYVDTGSAVWVQGEWHEAAAPGILFMMTLDIRHGKICRGRLYVGQ